MIITLDSIYLDTGGSRIDMHEHFHARGMTTFDSPTMLISEHTDLNMFMNEKDRDQFLLEDRHLLLHYTWTIVVENNDDDSPPIMDSNHRHNHHPFHIHIADIYSIKRIISSPSPPNNTTSRRHGYTASYETTVLVYNHRPITNIIIGIEPCSTRNKMIYHLFGDWSHPMLTVHLKILAGIQDLFTEIIIGVAVVDPKEQQDPIAFLSRYLDVHKIRVFTVPNNPRVGEATTFHALLARITNDDNNDYVLYAHSKGLGHPHDSKGVFYWTVMLYLYNIMKMDHVLYSESSMAGCFISETQFDLLKRANWHFSGSFYWFRPSALALTNLKQEASDYYVSEKFPSRVCPCLTTGSIVELCRAPDNASLYSETFYQTYFPFFLPLHHYFFPLSPNI